MGVNAKLRALLTKLGGTPATGDSNAALLGKIVTAVVAFPEMPSENGTYTLKTTKSDSGVELSWVKDI